MEELANENMYLKEIISKIYWEGPEMTWANFDDEFVDEVFEIACQEDK